MIPPHIRFDALLYLCNLVVAKLPSSRIRHWFYVHAMQVDLDPSAHILSGLWLDARGKCSIGARSTVNQNCRLDNRGGIQIGEDTNISPEVHILTADHDLSDPNFIGRERPVQIGSHVFLGTRAIILPGVKIGAGCAVAAGAVVTRDVEPLAIVAGVPAKKIGERPKDILGYSAPGKRHFF